SPIRTLTYDGDGALRSSTNQSNQKTHYVTPDYQVNLATGEVSVYYRFGGRAVAWRNNSGLRYVLADHLSSSQAEVGENQAEMGQRRFYPFGSDRAVSGANDIADEERFTGQRRIEAGEGNSRCELYYYGARWYLPGVGIFTQPDTIVPDYKNPQALNRFSYTLNNPLRYRDPTGH
ncbi:MAG: RHS repeat-associated core domain-containing protein, partial [Chloroflexi bacterium]|nr:RHS repeat-associated core domain-containing protein [Chloroflexota bacterium]